jgi:alpha-glucosidase
MTTDQSRLHRVSDSITFTLFFDDKTIFSHSIEHPFVYAGSGKGKYHMFRGNFHITERLRELVGLRYWNVVESGIDRLVVHFFSGPDITQSDYHLTLSISVINDRLEIRCTGPDVKVHGKTQKIPPPNRWRFHFSA